MARVRRGRALRADLSEAEVVAPTVRSMMQPDPRSRRVVHELQKVAAVDVHERAMIAALEVHILGVDECLIQNGLDAIHLAERGHRTGLAIREQPADLLF